jgi:hypothetical protein
MADHVIPGRDTSKFGLWWQKISTFFKKRAIWIGTAFIILGVAMAAFKLIHKTPHQKASEIVQKASESAVDGNFNEAIQQLLQAYDTETKPIVKAGIAYKLGIKYYQTGSREEGKKWLQTAADAYKKVGDNSSATAAEQQIAIQEGAQKIDNINNGSTGQSANTRGNLQDGNL